MRALLLVSLFLGFLVSGGTARGERHAPVRYLLSYPSPGSASVHVRIEVPGDTATLRTLLIPRAVPMGYGEEPYDQFIARVAAFNAAGKPLEVTRAEGPRWRLGPAMRVEYDVDVARMEQAIRDATNSSCVRPDYASLVGYSVFGFIPGWEDRPIELQIEAPKGWPVVSTLAPSGGPLRAENFYALADSQIAMGPGLHFAPVHYARENEAALTLAYYAEAEADGSRLERLSGEAMAAVMEYFAGLGPAPFAHYTVFLEFLKPDSKEHSYGFGMEHLESFHAALAAADANPATFPDGRLRYHVAHHVAHAWIPKRCYGEGYFPFPWEAAPRIDTIWFSEGFAQYAAIAALAASEEERRQMVERRFRSVIREAAPELRRMPLRELSLAASTQYASDFRIGKLTFSRGGLMAAEMDDRIRRATHGEKSLRDALRHLVQWSKQNRRAFRVEELPARFREATGVETKDIMDKWLAPLE
jgi:predicted metalloprotease with PDZ domain